MECGVWILAALLLLLRSQARNNKKQLLNGLKRHFIAHIVDIHQTEYMQVGLGISNCRRNRQRTIRMEIGSHTQNWFDLSCTECEWESLNSPWIENGESTFRIPGCPAVVRVYPVMVNICDILLAFQTALHISHNVFSRIPKRNHSYTEVALQFQRLGVFHLMVMKKNGPTDLAKNGCSFGGCEEGRQLCGRGE